MQKNVVWKWILLALLCLWSIWAVVPPSEKVVFGIDIKGGFNFVLQVDETALQEAKDKPLTDGDRSDAKNRALEVLRNRFDSSGVKEVSIFAETGSNRIILQVPGVGTESQKQINDLLNRPAYLQFRVVHPDNSREIEKLFAEGKAPPGYSIFDAAARLYKADGAPAKATGDSEDKARVEAEEKAKRDALRKFAYKPGFDFMLEKEERDGVAFYRPYYVSVKEDLNGESVEYASTTPDELGRPAVSLEFTSTGKKAFGDITANYAPFGNLNNGNSVGRQLAIVLDGTLYSAPTINEPIYGGNARITGSFSEADANQLSLVLRAGALPAPLKIMAQSAISPMLGEDSVRSGLRSCIIGAVLVAGFMLVYYRLAGIVANLAVLLNALLLPLSAIIALGFMSIFSETTGSAIGLPTLTLPGIAGFILTIGMAVDANVLIYERMREEQRLGKRFESVVNAGYSKAFSAIFDSNITTIITAVILYMLGTGAVRGFSVTLVAGILASLYTTLVFTRMVFDALVRSGKIEKLSMMSFFGEKPNFDFIGKGRIAITVSIVLIVGTWALMVPKGRDIFSVDFISGRSLTYQVKDASVGETEVRAVLDPVKVDAVVQTHKAVDTGLTTLKITVPEKDGEAAVKALSESKLNLGSIAEDNVVSGAVSGEMRGKAFWAIIWSLVALLIYMAFRFEFAFGMGAVVAVFHDVAVMIGIYVLLGHKISLTTVAAVLTVMGYSVNDTIVTFDRVRENLGLLKGRSYREIANISVNETLSRTILTSLTVLITVLVLLIFGGGAIYEFALAMFIGLLAGTYSTVYIATPVMLLWHKDDKAPNTRV
jgi:SecD/SecF fusion protein